MKLRIITFIELLVASILCLNAQEPEEKNIFLPNDSVTAINDSVIGSLPESLDEDMNNLLQSWHVKHFSQSEDFCEDQDTNPYFPDSIYRKRMQRLPFIIPMQYNDIVRKCIDLYSGKLRNKVRYMMGMADFYFPIMEEKLDVNGLPLELKYLAVVESALNPTAQSRVGALGLWQFMLPTGKINGLEINSLIDERLDPEKSTEAACKYFKEIYGLYGDWLLAIAAYNCGPGNVNKAIRRSGGHTDFWKIFPYLPRETRSYVPLFMAAAYIMTYHCEHNICPIKANFSVATDTIMVNRALHFDQIADILGMDKEAIRFYNPQYKREIVPGNIRPSILRLPIQETFAFINNSDTIYTHRIDELLANCSAVNTKTSDNKKEKITHIVESGETVYSIANLYGVTVKDLRKWNRLGRKTRRLKNGMRLSLYIDNGGISYSASAKNNETGKVAENKNESAGAKQNNTTTGNTDYTEYKVQSGDTLSKIASRYKGVSVKMIQRANGLTKTNLKVGQILKIPQV